VAKIGVPIGRFDPYVGAGLGLYRSTLSIDGTIFGVPTTQEETDTAIGEQLLAGIDVWFTERWALGFEYRGLFLKASFGSVTNGEVDVRGSSLIGALRYRW
jgi:opacity protein-like surface antigen